MRTNGRCNNSHAIITGLSSILLSFKTQYSWRTRIWKNINTILMYREKFYQLNAAQRQLLQPLNNLKKKPDPSETEITCNIKNSRLRFIRWPPFYILNQASLRKHHIMNFRLLHYIFPRIESLKMWPCHLWTIYKRALIQYGIQYGCPRRKILLFFFYT